jgi:hypothetical protein
MKVPQACALFCALGASVSALTLEQAARSLAPPKSIDTLPKAVPAVAQEKIVRLCTDTNYRDCDDFDPTPLGTCYVRPSAFSPLSFKSLQFLLSECPGPV